NGPRPADGSPQHGLRGARRPDPPGDPRAARRDVRRPHGRGSRSPVPDVAAGDLAPPEGPRAGRPHLPLPAGDRPVEPPGGRAPEGRLRLAREVPRVLDGEPRPVGRAAHPAPGASPGTATAGTAGRTVRSWLRRRSPRPKDSRTST